MDGSPGGGRALAEPAAVTASGDTTTAVFLYSGQKDGPPAACRVVARQGRRVRLELPGGKQVWREREHVLQPAELAVAALRRTLMVLPDPVGFCRGLDRNGDGVVTAAELAQGAAEAGVCLGSDECAALIELADQDGDGLLSVRELEMLAAVLQDVRALQADLCPAQPLQRQPRASAVLAVQLYTERPLTDAERRRPRRRRGRAVPICGGVLVAETLVFLPPNARRSELLAALSAELSLEEGGQHGHALEGLRERLGPGAGSEWEAVVSKFQKDPTVADLLSLGRSLPTPSHSDSVAGIQPPAVALELTHTDARWLISWTAQQHWRLRYSLARQRLALASILHPRLCPAAIDTTELSDVFGLIFAAGALMAHRYTRAREHTPPGRIDVPPGQQPTQPPNQSDDLAWLNELGPLITMQASKLYFAIRHEDGCRRA